MNSLNVFSKEFWGIKPNVNEYVHIFSGVANITCNRNVYDKQFNKIDGLLFNEYCWAFTITCIVEQYINNSGFFSKSYTPIYSKYILNGLRNKDSWDLKVENNKLVSLNCLLNFNVLNNQIMYSSEQDFTMKYTVCII